MIKLMEGKNIFKPDEIPWPYMLGDGGIDSFAGYRLTTDQARALWEGVRFFLGMDKSPDSKKRGIYPTVSDLRKYTKALSLLKKGIRK